MKAQLILFGVLWGFVAIAADSDSARDQLLDEAWDKGAEGKVFFLVVDENGRPVEGVHCTGWMRLFDKKEGGFSYRAETDTNGLAVVSGRCSESFSVSFSKEGYYKTVDEIFFSQAKNDPIIKEDGAIEIILKRLPEAQAKDIRSFSQEYREDRWLYEGSIAVPKKKIVYDFQIDADTGTVLKWEAREKGQKKN